MLTLLVAVVITALALALLMVSIPLSGCSAHALCMTYEPDSNSLRLVAHYMSHILSRDHESSLEARMASP
eukprot:891934-Amphidinium_carterae.1